MQSDRRLTKISRHVIETAPTAKGGSVEVDAPAIALKTEIPTHGKFFDDYSNLPKLTNDMAQAKRDIGAS